MRALGKDEKSVGPLTPVEANNKMFRSLKNLQIDPHAPPPGVFVYSTETYYDQLDGQMLLHHPRYLILVERAQQLWFEQLLGAPRFDWQNFPDLYLVVRRLEIDYLESIAGVMPVHVVLWPGQLRAAKQETHFAFFSEDGKRLFCRGRRVNCKVDPKSHQPQIWTDTFMQRMHAELDKLQAPWRTRDSASPRK
ncbi:MAG: hypothetical protein JJU20_05255 [Opitutales bacterium]|nr:hypothetical protein [Opitutales bacterium]